MESILEAVGAGSLLTLRRLRCHITLVPPLVLAIDWHVFVEDRLADPVPSTQKNHMMLADVLQL